MSTNSLTHCRTVDVADLQSRTRRSASLATTFAVLTTWVWVMVCACCSSRSRLYAAQISALVDLLVMDMDNSFRWSDRERRPSAIHARAPSFCQPPPSQARTNHDREQASSPLFTLAPRFLSTPAQQSVIYKI